MSYTINQAEVLLENLLKNSDNISLADILDIIQNLSLCESLCLNYIKHFTR